MFSWIGGLKNHDTTDEVLQSRSSSLSGYLWKLKRTPQMALIPQWHQRWFSIERHLLKWYATPLTEKSSGIVDLRFVTDIAPFESGGGVYSFIISYPDRNLLLRAPSQGEMDKWMRALRYQADIVRGGDGTGTITDTNSFCSSPQGKGRGIKDKYRPSTLEATLEATMAQLEILESQVSKKQTTIESTRSTDISNRQEREERNQYPSQFNGILRDDPRVRRTVTTPNDHMIHRSHEGNENNSRTSSTTNAYLRTNIDNDENDDHDMMSATVPAQQRDLPRNQFNRPMPSPLQRKSKSATRARDHRRSNHSNRDIDDGLGQYDSNNDLEDYNFSSFSSPRRKTKSASRSRDVAVVDDQYDSNNDFENNDFDSFRSTSIVNNSGRGMSNRRDLGRPLGNGGDSLRSSNKSSRDDDAVAVTDATTNDHLHRLEQRRDSSNSNKQLKNANMHRMSRADHRGSTSNHGLPRKEPTEGTSRAPNSNSTHTNTHSKKNHDLSHHHYHHHHHHQVNNNTTKSFPNVDFDYDDDLELKALEEDLQEMDLTVVTTPTRRSRDRDRVMDNDDERQNNNHRIPSRNGTAVNGGWFA